jgi:hypothetical protein
VACLSAEIGIYLARTGDCISATNVALEIREKFGRGEDAEVYVWLALLEGLIGFYTSATGDEKNSITRAFSVATAIGRVDLQQYAAAWLAHHNFNAGKYSAMNEWLRRSGTSGAASVSAKIRACITLADAWQHYGDDQVAARWYSIARSSAAEIGDRASIMASVENRAVMRLDRLWLRSVAERVELSEVLSVENELLGGLGYERFTRSESLVFQTPVWLFRLAQLKGNLEEAMEILTNSWSRLDGFQTSPLRSYAIEAAWVYCSVGMTDESRLWYARATTMGVSGFDTDDAAVYWRKLSMLDTRLGDGSNSIRYESLYLEAIRRHRSELCGLGEAIREFRL